MGRKRKQLTGELGTKQTDSSWLQKGPFLNKITSYETTGSVLLKQNNAGRCLYRLGETSNRCPAKPECSILRSAFLRYPEQLGHSSPPAFTLTCLLVGWISRVLGGICLHASINITKGYANSLTLWRDPFHCCCDDCPTGTFWATYTRGYTIVNKTLSVCY